jgi:hypothetical protein
MTKAELTNELIRLARGFQTTEPSPERLAAYWEKLQDVPAAIMHRAVSDCLCELRHPTASALDRAIDRAERTEEARKAARSRHEPPVSPSASVPRAGSHASFWRAVFAENCERWGRESKTGTLEPGPTHGKAPGIVWSVVPDQDARLASHVRTCGGCGTAAAVVQDMLAAW